MSDDIDDFQDLEDIEDPGLTDADRAVEPVIGPTPGPWHYSTASGPQLIGVYAGDAEEIVICDVSDEDLTIQGQCEANAKLIVSAPVMFDYIRRRAEAGDEEAIRILDGFDD